MEQVSIQVRPDLALALHGKGPATPESEQLLGAASQLGISLEPMHPGTNSPELMAYLTAYVSDAEKAREVVDALSQIDGVEAAYLVPPASPASPPSGLF